MKRPPWTRIRSRIKCAMGLRPKCVQWCNSTLLALLLDHQLMVPHSHVPALCKAHPTLVSKSQINSFVEISSCSFSAPVEGTNDYAIPGKCYNLPAGVGSIRYFCGRLGIPAAWLTLLPPPPSTTTGTTSFVSTTTRATTTAPITNPPTTVSLTDLQQCKDCATLQVLGNNNCAPNNPLMAPCLALPSCFTDCLLPFTNASWQPPVSAACRALPELDSVFLCLRPHCPVCYPFIGAPPPPGCASAVPSTWFHLRNDVCQCQWDCIDCHGGTVKLANAGPVGLEPPHHCECANGTASMDCQGCSGVICNVGERCDNSVDLSRMTNKVYICNPDAALVAFFPQGGMGVWSASFPSEDSQSGGALDLNLYSSPSQTPLLMTCALRNCTRNFQLSQQQLVCANAACVRFVSDCLLAPFDVLQGPSSVTISTNGLMQWSAPNLAWLFHCGASGCRRVGTETTAPVNPTTTPAIANPNCSVTIPNACVKTSDMSQWFKLRNDTCQCPWQCISCHGNGIPIAARDVAPTLGLDGPHSCACSSSAATMDCLGCTSGGCSTAGSVCDTSVFVTRTKAYSCIPDANLAQFFAGGGLFIWEVLFPNTDTNTGGTVELTGYADPKHTPLLFTCSLSSCTRSIDAGSQKIVCDVTKCTATESDPALALVVNPLKGKSTVILDPSGDTQMFQENVAITIKMKCTASGCKFPGEGEVKQSTLEVALASTFGALILVAILLLILICVKRAFDLRQKYLNFGHRRLERTLTWEHLACTLRFRVPSRKIFHKGAMKELRVLKPLDGEAAAGTVTALIGESGAGKTALLDMLALRKTFGTMDGLVKKNREIFIERCFPNAFVCVFFIAGAPKW
jgi:hypothetical protein